LIWVCRAMLDECVIVVRSDSLVNVRRYDDFFLVLFVFVKKWYVFVMKGGMFLTTKVSCRRMTSGECFFIRKCKRGERIGKLFP